MSLPSPFYTDEAVTLYHGDAMQLLPALSEAHEWAPFAAAVITDPPYNETSLEWDRWPEGWLVEASRVAHQLWCFGSFRMFMERSKEFQQSWKLAQDVIWEKHNGSGFDADRFKRVHEQVAHFYHGEWKELYREPQKVPGDARAGSASVRKSAGVRAAHRGRIETAEYQFTDERLQRSVIYAKNCHGFAVNETQKPEEIMAPLVQYSVPPGGLVVDCFAGSGTTGVVARKTGRRAILIEKREAQCRAIVDRLAQRDLLGTQ